MPNRSTKRSASSSTRNTPIKATTISFGKDTRPHIPISIGRVPASLLADTGAKYSCTNASFLAAAEAINGTTFRRTPATTLLVGANANALSCKDVAHIPLHIRGIQVTWPFHVVDDLQPAVLAGMDLLSFIGATVNAAANTIVIHGPPSPVALVAQHDAAVDGLSTASIRVKAVHVLSGKPLRCATGTAECPFGSILPGIISTSEDGASTVAAINSTACLAHVTKGSVIGTLSPMEAPESSWMPLASLAKTMASAAANPPIIAPVQPAPQGAQPQQPPKLRPADMADRRRRLAAKLQLRCPHAYADKYRQLLLEFADVFSLDENDLGFCSAWQHRIDLTTDNPVHVPQFRLPMAQQRFVENRVKELAKLKVIEPSTSPYNTPIFAVPKKSVPGLPPSYRIIQDLRAINRVTRLDRHSIADVRACLDKIGQLKAKVFSSIDLRSGFWQLGLAKESRPLTAFTLPSLGQWQWAVTTMGLTGAPASFSKLMEIVMRDLDFILRYLDDLLAASTSHEEHLQHLRLALSRLRTYGLKINPEKSIFGAASVEYLGHTVSSEGFTVGEHKFAALQDFPEPNSRKKVQQFLGLANFFRQLIPSFQKHAGHLSALLANTHVWKAGPLPPQARLAFHALRKALMARPVVAFPDPAVPFVLATDAAVGDDNNPGGLGAVLTQTINGHDRVIAYASRALKQHEKKQSAFQLELQAVIWAIEHFGPYLRHSTFEVVTDHRPVANLSQQQLKSLHRLHEKMLEFPCVIKYRPGVLNDIADALSRNVAPTAPVDEAIPDLTASQASDSLCQAIRAAMAGDATALQPWPQAAALLQQFTIHQGLLCLHDPQADPDGRRVVAPSSARLAILRAAHDHPLAGHKGVAKTTAAVTSRYWWPRMHDAIQLYVRNCSTCQKSKNPPRFSVKAPLHPIPPPVMPNQRVHADLFGPLPPSRSGNRWILTMTCAFSKFVRIVPLPNKESTTVAAAILAHWIAVFGPMQRLVTDQGREFNCKLLRDLLSWLGIEARTTSAMAPSVNGEAEIFNKWIASYLKAMQSATKADWEGHLAALNLAYNSAVHSAHSRQPGAVMFGRRLALPHLDPSAPPKPAVPWLQHQRQHLAKVWQATHGRLTKAADRMMQQQQHISVFAPMLGERVLLYYPRTALAAHGPPKLQQQWKEAIILGQLTPVTYLVRLRRANAPPSMVHINRLKPFQPRTVLPRAEWAAASQAATTQVAAAAAAGQAARVQNKPSDAPQKRERKAKKKKKKKRSQAKPNRHSSSDSSSDSSDPEDDNHQQQQLYPLQPPQPPQQQQQQPFQSPYWLRSSPLPPYHTPAVALPTAPRRRQHQQQEDPWEEYYSCSDNAESTDDDAFAAAQPDPSSPANTRSRGFRFPQPLPLRAAPRAVRALQTRLAHWRNIVRSSSSSSSNDSAPAAAANPNQPQEQQAQPQAEEDNDNEEDDAIDGIPLPPDTDDL